MSLTLTVNGVRHELDVSPDTPLLWALRETLALTGTKFGCGAALCGACTVHLDGVPTRSCVTPVSAVGTRTVTTIEGAVEGPAGPIARALQEAWVAHDVPQCGYCQSGQIMGATALLVGVLANLPASRHTAVQAGLDAEQTQRLDAVIDAAIDDTMRGHLCRCGTYQRIRAAIHAAAATLMSAADKPQIDRPVDR